MQSMWDSGNVWQVFEKSDGLAQPHILLDDSAVFPMVSVDMDRANNCTRVDPSCKFSLAE